MSGYLNAAKLALRITIGAGIGLAALASAASAAANNAQMYSATAISQIPGQPERVGKIVKSGSNMRLEYQRNGRDTVQIILPTKGLMYFLNPKTKTYSEIRGQAVPERSATEYKSPCPPAPNTRCERIGQATISGIQAERWLIATPGQAGPVVILWDPARRHALSEEFSNGGKMLMTFRAMEDISGRPTERWDISLTRPGQKTATGTWWFDPELRVAVRENLPGGETRRLDDLVVGPVDPALFQVPDGWTRVKQAAPSRAQPANPAPQAAKPASE